jgi:DNA-binding transcriptional ArsR family regulator
MQRKGVSMADEQQSGGEASRHHLRWAEVPELGKAILGNETRLGVLVEVAMGVGRATPIAERLGVERCDVSKHMGVLFHSGLVRASQEDPLAYVLAPHVRVRRDATGVDIVVAAGKGLELRVAVTTAED